MKVLGEAHAHIKPQMFMMQLPDHVIFLYSAAVIMMVAPHTWLTRRKLFQE
tara:strand:+ start:171 stop:323 length:153 start_codon:yes stop_codon:yes gene_type:complete